MAAAGPGALLEDGDIGGAAACHADCRLAHGQASSCGSAPPGPACKMGYPSITPGAGPTGAAWCGMRSQPPGWPCGGTAPSPVPRPGVLVGGSALAGRRCVQGPAQSPTLGQDSPGPKVQVSLPDVPPQLWGYGEAAPRKPPLPHGNRRVHLLTAAETYHRDPRRVSLTNRPS